MCFAASLATGYGQAVLGSISKQFTPAQRQATGIDKLTPAEQDALRAVVRANIQAEILQREQQIRAEAQQQAMAALQARRPPPAAKAVQPIAKPRRALTGGVVDDATITQVTGHGSLITLDDETVWQVSPVDRADAALWTEQTDILILDDSDDATYSRRMVSKDDNEIIHVRQVR